MIDWRARFPERNPNWGPDLPEKLAALHRAERALAATPEFTADKSRREHQLRREIRAATFEATRTVGEYMATRLAAADFENRAALRGLTLADVERALPRKIPWRAAPDVVARLLRAVQ